MLFNTSVVIGQTAITAVSTSYLTAASGTTYSATGAPGSPLAGNTYTYNFGNLSGSTNNNLQLNNFIAGATTYKFVTIPYQFVKIRRVNNAVVTGIRNLRYSEGSITGTVANIVPEYEDNMESFFNGNTAFNSGSDNLFANQGDGNGNNNNIERLDVIFPRGISATDNSKIGFTIFERGDVNVHDPIKVAVVLSVDASGNPTSYSGIISILASNYGTANPVANYTYVISRRDTAIETRLKAAVVQTQGVGGAFLKVSDFSVSNNTTFYGYSIIPNDFTGSTSADIINYNNATLYPTNTSSATGSGGIDLISATGAFIAAPVIGNYIAGTVFDDINGLTNSLVDGTGTNANGVNAVLINSSGNVEAIAAVVSDGTYSFGGVPAGTYSVLLTTAAATVGAAAAAATLPAGWVYTGEGTAAAGDGAVNGRTNTFTVSSGSVTGVNFGIEQPATAGTLTAASQVNPGGTTGVTVAASTFSGTDVSGGTIASILISAFPSNATSITINGASYTSATFPGAGISVPASTSGQPTQTIVVDPVNGAVTVVIPYYVIDNAGKQSAATGTASLPFTTLSVSGNVYNDVNGLTNSLVDGAGTNGGGVYAILVDGGGLVAATTAVASDGTYTLNGVSGGTYSVKLSTTAGTPGVAPPAASLPPGWVNTGEGTTVAGDGTVNGQTNTFVISTVNVTNVNFGIEQRPTAGGGANSAVNPGGTTQVTVPTSTFTNTTASSDPSPGAVTSIRITAFPAGATTIVINGTSYTSATFPGVGVTVPTDASGNPTQTITVDPAANGATSVTILFVAKDAAGVESLIAGSAVLTLTAISISGNVYNDVNGLSDNTVGGTGTNGGGLNVILVDVSTGNVVATAVVPAGGAYSFTNQNSGNYNVIITTNTGTVGNAPPAIALPAGYVSVGENLGAAAGSDGTVNSTLPLGSISANTTNANFGIEQRPTAGGGGSTTVNQVGIVQISFPASTFTNTTASSDPSPGAVTSIRITAFPAGATTIVINGTSYTSATFPGVGVTVPTDASGNPTQTITVDPAANGATSVTILFVAKDAAGVESLIAGSAVLTLANDIDDDDDGITDIDESGGYDPFADCDSDGIPNYADTTPGCATPSGSDPWGVPYKPLTWSDANSDGINDFFDTDKDGIMNELDLDTDNDGIPDIVEAGGIDTNGDGKIDNLADTDGDGLANTYDVSNGGVNIASLDTDGDGVPNFKDLDSDNDGIPDVVEAYGADADNDGLLDNYTDTDKDGLSDNADGDVGNDGIAENSANALITTSIAGSTAGRPATYLKANADNAGMPNPYDLDSDGDGLTDAAESGITAAAYSRGMISGCTLVNGWCTSVDALASLNLSNTDGNGRADVYDIDADNDGITDNIEAQPTSGYIVPTDADTDGDGIADVYDSYSGMGGNGLTAYDYDGDGTPDYKDTDTDNDGAPDRNEADKNNMTLTQAAINAGADSDGDGLMDIFDVFNLAGQTTNLYINVTNSNFGPLGNWDGPMPDGSNVSLVQSSVSASNRDWRNVSLLPLDITIFTGKRSAGTSLLAWSADNEQQTLQYIIERSFDAMIFDSIGFVTSAQKSHTQYTYTDKNKIENQVIYYRIKQLDKSGKIIYTPVIKLTVNSQQTPTVSIWPNPVKSVLKVKITAQSNSIVSMSVTDMRGRQLILQQRQAQPGENSFALPQISTLVSGIYIVKICTGTNCYTKMLTKN